MALEDRITRLELAVAGPPLPSEADWPLQDQAEALADALRLHRLGRSVYTATNRELSLLDALIAADVLPESARALVEPMDAADQPGRERWLRATWPERARDREQAEKRIAWHREHGWHNPTPSELL